MKPCTPIRFLILWCGFSCCLVAHANNILVSNITLTGRNLSSQFVLVQFNLSWENSWRTSTTAPFNWDAAWVFVKYKVGATGDWKHATLSTSGHTIPSIASTTQSDATGMFIFRSADGTGTFSPSSIQLRWNYGSDGVANDATITVKVYAIEMVYHPPTGFQVGSGASSVNDYGEFRRANDVTSSGTASTFTITGTNPTLQGNSSSASPTNMATYNNTASDLTGTATASLNTGYPTGFDAFYSMKYEISQQQYVDFLNTLTYTQQAARTAVAPTSTPGTGALVSNNANRNGIDIQTSGIIPSQPAVYACNLNGNGTYNESDDGQHIACNFLNWDDVAAFLDWAALRPLTELEYEKACRGTVNPVTNEFAWGNTTATNATGLSNANLTNETASNGGANIIYNTSAIAGPGRVGMFANNTSARSSSGAGYYGSMELSGNLWERCVTVGNSTGRNFSAVNGNGSLTAGGAADVTGWPAAAGAGLKGGGWQSNNLNASISGRQSAASGDNTRQSDFGGRGARSSATGIVTNGLVLWLDAGIPTSYPTSGNTWTDLSGNRNNGTLVNGPTYNSNNEGVLSFTRASNQYISSNFISGNVYTYSIWFNTPLVQSGNYYNLIMINLPTYLLITLDGSAQSISFWTNDGLSGNILGVPTILTNIWYNITFVREGNSISNGYKTYLNGTFRGSANTGSWSTTSTLWVGSRSDVSVQAFNGMIGGVTGYNRALSAAEILQNFNAQKARFGL